MTVANGHLEKIDKGDWCPWYQTYRYHIIETDGYNRGRDQAVQDLLATGLYRVLRQENWGNDLENKSCDDSKESGDGIVIVLERIIQ